MTARPRPLFAIGLGGGFGITFTFHVFSAVWMDVRLLTVLVFRTRRPLSRSQRQSLTDVETRPVAA